MLPAISVESCPRSRGICTLAIEFGLAAHGPDWVYGGLLKRLIQQFDLVATELEVASKDALPSVALIMAHYNPDKQFGRWVLWHHVKGTDDIPSFHYALDPAYWIAPELKVTRDFNQLLTPKQPIHYLEITQKPDAKATASPAAKGKGK